MEKHWGSSRPELSDLSSKRVAWIFRYSCVLMLFWSAALHALPPNFQTETLVSGLQQPVFLVDLPDGRLLVGEKQGIIRIIDPNVPSPAAQVYLDISEVTNQGGERGLTAIALDPNFQANGYLYVYYARAFVRKHRLSRFTHNGDTADPTSEVVLWEHPEIYKDFHHYGGAIGFGPDGALYFATGDEYDGLQSQDLTIADGKVLRINPDGTIPADNPFADGPGGNLDEIWARGMRNPFRGYWDLVTGRFYVADVGGNVPETAREEINVILAGHNYGWPECEGQCEDPAFEDPLFDYGHYQNPNRVGGSVSLGEVYYGTQFPSEYVGALFYADYVQRWIRYLKFNPDGSVASDNIFAGNDEAGLVVHIIFGQNGSMYLADVSGAVKRIRYSGGSNQPPDIQGVTYDPLPGPAPAQVTFSVTASDPDGDSLTYQWDTGDGATLSGATVTHEYPTNGIYDVRVQVSDGAEITLSETVTVQVGIPPVALITEPLTGALFRAGDLIAFDGSASMDPDGPLDESSYSWDIRFGHNDHTHPTLTGYAGSTGTLEVNTSGHDYHSNTRYEFELTVTDSDGLTATDTVIVYPEKVDMVLDTSPVDLSVFIDSIQQDAPITYDTLVGFQHVVSAPAARCVDGIQYVFDSWSDGGSLSHTVTVPETGLNLTAQYTVAGSCTGVIADGLVLSLDADKGVQASGTGVVQGWDDQSAAGNHLVGVGDPQLLQGVLNGKGVVAFDGSGDRVERLSGLSGLPAGGADRSVLLVINYESTGHGGFGYGNNACNQAFAPSINKSGQLMVQGWCGDYDFHTGVAGTGQGWMIHSAVVRGGVVEHYKNGQLIDSFSHAFDTQPSRLMIGAELDNRPQVSMQLARALVYDRALTSAELAQMHDYLAVTYLPLAEPQPPVASDDATSVAANGTVTIDLLANDIAVGGASLVPSSVQVVTSPSQGVVLIDAAGMATYTHLGGEGGTDSFTYQVSDSNGQVSGAATVTLSIDNGGSLSQPPLAVDDSVTVDQGDLVLIDVLANDSDPDGDLDPSSVVVVTGPSVGEVTVDPETGEIFYEHDGTNTTVDSFGYQVSDSEGLVSGTATVSIGIVLAGGGPPIAFDDAVGVMLGQSTVIDVLANDLAVGAPLDPASVFIATPPSHGSVVSDPLTGEVTYTHDGLAATSDSFGYQVLDTDGQTSNEATVSVAVGDVGFGGLVLHLEADSGVATASGGVVQGWSDQAGFGNNLTAWGNPVLLATGLNGHPVIEFDGSDRLERIGGVTGLPEGSSDRTMVLLIKYDANGHGGVGYGTNECNQAFSPSVNNSGQLMVQGWCGSSDFHTDVPGTGQGWLIQSVVYGGSQLDHYVNGELIDTFSHSFNTTAARIMIGAELDSRPRIPMQLAAVLLFDSALSPDDLASVESYLAGKYGLE